MTPDQRIGAVAEIRTVRPVTDAAARAGVALRPMNLRELSGRPVPSPRFLVPHRFPLEAVTGLGGHSGFGKSRVMLHLLVAVALGRPWFGLSVRQGPALGIFCEDTEEVLHTRLARIAEAEGATLADLAENLTVISRVGLESEMAAFNSREYRLETTPFFGHALNMATDLRARVTVLDSLHDVYGRDEIKRAEARWFVNQLRLIALESGGAVVVPSHPSHSGLQNKTGESGSTAWRAAFRQFLHLDRIGDEDSKRLRLRVTKSNYGPTGLDIALIDDDGVLRLDEVARPPEKASRLSDQSRRCLDMLKEAIAREGHPAPASDHIPKTVKVVSFEQWRAYAYAGTTGTLSESDNPEARKKAFQRATAALVSRHHVGKWQEYVWLIG